MTPTPPAARPLLGALALCLAVCQVGCEDKKDTGGTYGSAVGVGPGATGAGTGSSGEGGSGQGGAGQGAGSSGTEGSGGDGPATGSGAGSGQGGASTGEGATGSGGGSTFCVPGEGALGGLAIEAAGGPTCEITGGTSVVVAPQETSPGYFDRLLTIGAHRVAGGGESFGGPFWLDADGSSIETESFFPGGRQMALDQDGDEIAILGDLLELRRFGSDREPIGTPANGDGSASGPEALLSAGEGWIVAWGDRGSIHAQRFDGSLGDVEAATVLQSSAYSEDASMGAAVTNGVAHFVYAGDKAATWTLGIASVATTLAAATSRESVCGEEHIKVLDVAALDDGLLVLTGNRDRDTVYLIRLDDAGDPVPPALELSGAVDGYGLRRNGGAVGVVAELATGEPAFRGFDASSLEPLGDWSCMATAAASGWPIALDIDGTGFAILHADDAGGISLTTIDSSGN